MTNPKDPKRLAQDLLHDCDRLHLYHKERQAFLERLHYIMMTIMILSGSTAVVGLHGLFETGDEKWFLTFLVVLPAVITAITAVWNPANKARDHDIWAREYKRLNVSIDWPNANSTSFRRWNDTFSDIAKGESGYYSALNAFCFNAATIARDQKPKYMLQVKGHHKLFRNVFRFSSSEFPIVYSES